ncbi:helix-turn-helix domain-containing protein, partial [uncultured Desulfovibrio sp.]
MEAKPNCSKCHAGAVYRNGKVLGKQRYPCKECEFQFTRTTPRGRPAHEKALVVTLYTMGLSLPAIARLFHVSTPAVLRWVRNFAAGKRIVVIGNVQNFSHIEWLNRLDAS